MNRTWKIIIASVLVLVVVGIILFINRPIVMLDSYGVSNRDDLLEQSIPESGIISVSIDGNLVVLGSTTSGDIQDYGWEISNDFIETDTCRVKFTYRDGVVVGYDLTKKDDVSWDDVYKDLEDSNYLGEILVIDPEYEGYLTVWADGMEKSGDGWYNNISGNVELSYFLDEDTRIVEIKGKLL